MMTQRAEMRAQVFKVLTPAQQTQLAALEAQMQAHRHGPARRRARRPTVGRKARDARDRRLPLGGADPVFFEQIDHTALTDQMAGADDHQIILVVVEQRFDFGHPLAVARAPSTD